MLLFHTNICPCCSESTASVSKPTTISIGVSIEASGGGRLSVYSPGACAILSDRSPAGPVLGDEPVGNLTPGDEDRVVSRQQQVEATGKNVGPVRHPHDMRMQRDRQYLWMRLRLYLVCPYRGLDQKLDVALFEQIQGLGRGVPGEFLLCLQIALIS